jgi:hypothetical protein
MDDDASHTERTGVLGCVMLYDPFEPIELGITLAGIAKKKLLTVLLSMGLDFGVKDPFHVLQNQPSEVGSVGRIHFRFSASGANSGLVLGYLCVESFPYIDQNVGSELWAVLIIHLLTTIPAIANDFVCIPTNSRPQRSLNIIPFSVDEILCFWSDLDILISTLIKPLLNHSGLSESIIFSLFGFLALGEKSWFEDFPGTII